NTQLPALTADTRYVTISVGGNDAGFSSVLTTCALPSWLSNCTKAVNAAQATINTTIPARLTSLYRDILSKAPAAKVIVVGYPRIFNGDDCNALTWFSPSEESRLNATADLLNTRTASAAAAAGFTFVNPTSVFTGHAVCDRVEWLNGLSYPVTESYHPNRGGHANGYAPLTQAAFSLPVSLGKAAAAADARSTAGALARDEKRWAALDRTVTPKPFVLPDLSTPQAKAAARAAGIDLSSRASIDRADRQFQARQDAAWATAR
ncbi:MAG: SGNH/GDSL hydrolase family protein, partial [Terracoccus sp.]